MKTDELVALGLTTEQAASVLAINGKDIEKLKTANDTANTELATVREQMTEANKTIEGFKAMDIEGIKHAADEWKAKAERAEQDATDKIAEMEFGTLLDSAIIAAGGRNAKVVRAALDVAALRGSSNRDNDIKTALEALKTDSDYLFESKTAPPPYAAGTGSAMTYSPEMTAVRAAAGLKTE